MSREVTKLCVFYLFTTLDSWEGKKTPSTAQECHEEMDSNMGIQRGRECNAGGLSFILNLQRRRLVVGRRA